MDKLGINVRADIQLTMDSTIWSSTATSIMNSVRPAVYDYVGDSIKAPVFNSMASVFLNVNRTSIAQTT